MSNILKKQRKNTEDFLGSYLIRRKLSEVSGYDENNSCEVSEPVELAPINDFHPQLEVGQIRLLSQTENMTYVVLLQRWEEDSFLTMAFSHYDFPATDEEFKPQFDRGLYLNTFQAWNTRTISDKVLAESWHIDDLPESDLQDARDFWHHLITGAELPERLLERSGVPITKENDIRIEYMQKEMQNFAKIEMLEAENEQNSDNEILENTEQENIYILKLDIPPVFLSQNKHNNAGRGYSLAAGGEECLLFVKCKPFGYDEVCTIEYEKDENILRVKFYTSDQKAYSHLFDKWEIIDEEENILGVIANGRCIIENLSDFDGKCALRSPQGEIVIFDTEEEL